MTPHVALRHYSKAARHFAATRALEVLALQASPVLGCFLAGFTINAHNLVHLGLLVLGSIALTTHVFVFNDWAGHNSDKRDARRAPFVFSQQGISQKQVARIAVGLLICANVAFAFVGSAAILFGAAITILSLLYSCSPHFGKGTPIATSLNHLLGGALHFLLGYSSFHTLDAKGILISLFFGLVFAAGHLNQEVRDYEGDFLNSIRTNAVVFGCRRTFLASLFVFTTAYALLAVLAVLGILPKILLLSAIAWPVHVVWSMQAIKRGLGFESAVWMQRRYRLLFGVIGLAMLWSGFSFR